MSLWYKIQSKIFTFIGDIKWSGVLHPFWFTINAQGYRLKGSHYRNLKNHLLVGDILIRRFEGYVDKWFIPGWWNHCGIFIGDTEEQVIHAISDGVIMEDILNFMRTDHMLVLRPDRGIVNDAINKAIALVGTPYDFGFDFKDCNRFSCTELISFCYPGLVQPRRSWKSLGKKVIIADDFYHCNKLTEIWDSRKPEVYWLTALSRKFKESQ